MHHNKEYYKKCRYVDLDLLDTLAYQWQGKCFGNFFVALFVKRSLFLLQCIVVYNIALYFGPLITAGLFNAKI